MHPASRERFDLALKDFIDFVNAQSSAYMDALAGYAGHYTRVERQVHRVMRPRKITTDEAGNKVVVSASYEDPSQPDVVLNRIVRASDYLAANAVGGSNEQQHVRAILIFIYTFWELDIRPRLAAARGVALNEIRSDIMGDLRVLRNVILHSRSILRQDKHSELKKLGKMFVPESVLHVGYENLHQIFVLVKQDCGRMIIEWSGAGPRAPIAPDQIRGIAIQRVHKPSI